MKFRQIEAFRQVMQHGTITRAAKAMALSQPAVSHLISDLEHYLQFRLFMRHTGLPLAPTPEAESFYAVVSRSFVGLDELVRAARDIKMFRGAHLRIVAPAFIANSIVCDACASFLEAQRDASATIDVRPHQDIVAMIASRVVDIAVAVLPIDNPAIEVTVLGDFELLCAIPDDNPLARSDRIRATQLADQALITNTNGSQIDLIAETLLHNSGVSMVRRVAARNHEIACNLVARGLGIAVLASPLPSHLANYPGVQFRGFQPATPIRIGALLPAARQAPNHVLDFIEQLRASTLRLQA